MYRRSSKFDSAIQSSHRAALRVIVRTGNGQVLLDTDSATVPLKQLIDGEITATSDAVRRSGQVTLIGQLSGSYVDQLIDETTTWQFYKGITYPDGTKELGSIGILRPSGYALDDSGQSVRHRISVSDHSLTLSEHRLATGVGINAGAVDAAVTLIKAADPNVSFGQIGSSLYNPTKKYYFPPETDPWAKALQLLKEVGLEAFFDVNDQIIVRDIPSVGTVPISWRFLDNQYSVFMNIQKTSERRRYNHVVLSTEAVGSGTPFIAHAYDTDPSSPTYYYGPYGDVPYFYKANNIQSQAQADATALAVLRSLLGRKDVIVISAVVNPFFEVGDVVYLERSEANVVGSFLVDRLSYPLTHDRPMYLTLRRGIDV